MKRRRWWCALALLAALPAQAGLQLMPEPHDLLPHEAAVADRVIARAQSLLPEGLTRGAPRPVGITWSDALPDRVHGRARNGHVLLRRSLLSPSGDPAAPTDHAVPQAALAALLHEIAHVHDRSPGGGLSREGRWRDIAGWQQRPWRLGRVDNDFALRSPDAYERHSPAEAFAVNFEHFMLDPGFACRRPAMHAWYVEQLGASPLPTAACADAMHFVQADDDQGAVSLLRLDPARVYAVDYLFAEGSGEAMSLWGHTMLRLVICAPGRAPGPACRMDLQHHRVLSFRAFVGDVQLSGWGGLAGAYPSRLFVLPLAQVIEEYTRVELRALQSLPLDLQQGEIAALLERAANSHWSYDGRYYFVSGNCAVETARLLQAAAPRLERMGINRLSPRGVLRRLRVHGALDASVLDDREAAIRDGYYFPSAAPAQRAIFDGLRERGAIPAGTRSLEAWLDGDALQRRPVLLRGSVRDTAGLLLLEQAAWRRQQLQAKARLKHLLGGDAAQRTAVEALLRQSGQLLQPAAMVADLQRDLHRAGYGLPSNEEAALLATHLPQQSAEHRMRWRDMQEELLAQLPAREARQLRGSEENLRLLGHRLREQASATP